MKINGFHQMWKITKQITKKKNFTKRNSERNIFAEGVGKSKKKLFI